MSKPRLILNDPPASRLWNQLKKKLIADGRWRDRYEPHFAVFIHALAKWLLVSAKLQAIATASAAGNTDAGMILVNPRHGTTYVNPLINVQSSLVNTIKSFGVMFGLNPMADARLLAMVRLGGGDPGPLFASDVGIEDLGRGPQLDGPPPGP